MKIGVLKEIKEQEYRVGLTPASALALIEKGHKVLIQKNAGFESGFLDEVYRKTGAEIVDTADEIFENATLIIKVKEPQPQECVKLRKGQVLFAYLHLAPDPTQAELLLASNCIAIAYETVTDKEGGLPLLKPMSAVAGRFAIQAGAHCLEKRQGGRGILLGGVAGVAPAKVMVIGTGVVGKEAILLALSVGAEVLVLYQSLKSLPEVENLFQGQGKMTLFNSTPETIEENIKMADLVIAAVLVPGATAPKLVSRQQVRRMKPGSVIVDVSIDQGGCFETSRPTTHANPIYIEEDVVHYCVTNMPAGVPLTSTIALNHATLPYIMELADKGYKRACLENPYLLQGLNILEGKLTHPVVAKALGKPYTEPIPLLT